MSTRESLYQAIVVTAEIIGHEISPAAAREMTRELLTYPESQVASALSRCKRELTGRLTLAAIIQRIDDGHLGIEEAWALVPRNEADTVVWTDEIAQAYGVCSALLETDQVAARMAFKESYSRALAVARAERRAARWWVCLGHDQARRITAIKQALDVGRLTLEEATRHVHPDMPGYHALAPSLNHKALPAATKQLPASAPVPLTGEIQTLISNLRERGGDF